MNEQVIEFHGAFHDVMVITELRGSYPTVPIAADVDYAALIAGDDDPQFLTLPIGKANVTSGNKRYYDDAFVMELMRQTLATKPIGLMGHLSESERATAFPRESLHWVGAVRDGDLIWGKAYLIGEARERVRRYKASGKSIATSIDAYADGVWDESLKAYRMDATTLRLNQIDLAPADRAGIPDLAAIPHLTSEFAPAGADTDEMDAPEPDSPAIGAGTDAEQEPTMAEKEQVITELRSVRVPPQRGWQPPSNPQEVTEMAAIREILGVDEKADLPSVIAEMRQKQDEQRQDAIKSRVRELASDAEKGIKIAPVREIVISMVEALEPKTIEEAEAKYHMISTSGPITEVLKNRVVQTMGPPQGTPLQKQHGNNKYFNIPQDEKERA